MMDNRYLFMTATSDINQRDTQQVYPALLPTRAGSNQVHEHSGMCHRLAESDCLDEALGHLDGDWGFGYDELDALEE